MREERGGIGRGLAEKGSSITADKRKRIMICKDEKDGESWAEGERARQRRRKSQGKNRKK